MHPLPILYSFRRCPYAMRARLALVYAGIAVEQREVALKNKPPELLAISPKATVPVLQLPEGQVLAESLDIMHWALAQHDPDHWLQYPEPAQALIAWNDGDFKQQLDRYKYADRFPQHPASHYRQQGALFLAELENCLAGQGYLCSNHCSLADAAIVPFIRQFAAVDAEWFRLSGYDAVKTWLAKLLASALFASIMRKYPTWQQGSEVKVLS